MRLLVAAIGVVLVVGLVIGLASLRDAGGPAVVDAPVTVPATSPSPPVSGDISSSTIDSADVDAASVYPCGDSPTGTEVRTWSSDTVDVSLVVTGNDALVIRVTDESGEARQSCLDSASAKAGLEDERSLVWVGPVDDGVLIAIAHPYGRAIVPIDELTRLGPVASVGSSDYDLTLYFASPDDQLPSGSPSLEAIGRLIQQALDRTTSSGDLGPDVLVAETDDDFASSDTFVPPTEPIRAEPLQAIDFNLDEPGSLPSLFGFQFATTIDPDLLSPTIDPVLGPPDIDTGWLPMPPTLACTGADQYRSILWADARFVLNGTDTNSDGELDSVILAAWSVGDAPLTFSPPLTAPITQASGLTDPGGLGIGSPKSAIAERPFQLSWEDNGRVFALAGIGPVVFDTVEDHIVAMSIEANDC